MKVLVVGAGALGEVFGLWLARGGTAVSYLVRPGRDGWADEGRTVYRLRRLGKPVAEALRPEQVRTEATGDWDAVWLCVSSHALREPWVRELRDRVGSATIVTIGQDAHDKDVLRRVWPEEQIVQVVPSVLAYQAPLTDEVPAPGVAYWLPPGAGSVLNGPEERARAVVAALRAGGVRAKYAGRTGSGELIAAKTVPYVAALEVADWSLTDLRPGLGSAAAAAHEATTVIAALTGGTPPRAGTPPWLAGLVLRLLPLLVPFDLRRYLRAHFTKVAPQTRMMLDSWITEGESRDLPVARLKELRHALPIGASS